MTIFNIVKSVDKTLMQTGQASVSDRYYQHKYCKTINEHTEVHQRVSFHSNRMCMISLTEQHPVLQSKISKINWKINGSLDRELNVVSGKGKRYAQRLEQDSIICHIETIDGNVYPIYSCMKGKLIEINGKLNEDPSLLQTHPVSYGYICLILPNLKAYSELKTSMLSEEEYFNEMQ